MDMINYNVYHTIADIKNGLGAKKKQILIQKEKYNEALLQVLWNEGFINGYKVSLEEPQKIIVFLKYKNNMSVINSVQWLSTPGRRVSYSIDRIWKIDSSRFFVIFSTDKGILSIDGCKKLKVGGEALLLIK